MVYSKDVGKAVALAALLAAGALFIQGCSNPLPLDNEISKGVLANGLEYYVQSNHTPGNTAVLKLVVNTGSVAEQDHEQGFAHFNEHLSFTGTEHFPENSLITYFQSAGMHFGSDINAYTSFDQTVYELTLPTGNEEHINKGLLALYDWAAATHSTDSAVEAERRVILEEFRTRHNVQERLFNQSLPYVLQHSKYAERIVIGTPESISQGSPQAIRNFREEWYKPELMTVIAVGSFEQERMEEKVKEIFGAIPKSPKQKKQYVANVPGHKEVLTSTHTDKDLTRNEVMLLYKHPYKAVKSVKDYRNNLGITLYNQLLNNRFEDMVALDDRDLPVFSAHSFYSRTAGKTALYGLGSSAKNSRINETLLFLLRESRNASQYGFTKEELERVKQELESNLEQWYSQKDQRTSYDLAQKCVSHVTLDQSPLLNPAFEYELYRSLLNKITLKEVNRTGKRLVSKENRVVVINVPEKDSTQLPTHSHILRLIQRTETEKMVPQQAHKATRKELVTENPVPGKVVEEKKVEGIDGLVCWTLSNGATVYLLPTTYRNNQIYMSGISYGGSSLYNNADLLQAELSADIVVSAGLGDLDPAELSQTLAGKSAGVRMVISSLSEAVGGNATNADLKTMLELLYLRFTAPRESRERYNSYVEKMELRLQNKYLNPAEAWYDTITHYMTGGNPRIRPLTAERTTELSYEKAYRIYKERFSNAADFRFIFTGSFTLPEIKPLIETYIGSIPGQPQAIETWKDHGIRPATGSIDHILATSNEDRCRVLMEFYAPIPYSMKHTITARTLGTVISDRLLENIRGKLGGVYSIGATPRITKYPQEEIGYSIQFICNPQRQEELKKAVLEELKKLKETPLTREELEVYKGQMQRQLEVAQETNDYWIGNIQDLLYNKEDVSQLARYPLILNAITPSDIRQLAASVFDFNQYKSFTFLPPL